MKVFPSSKEIPINVVFERLPYKIWFAWYPVRTDMGWIWLKDVFRYDPPKIRYPKHRYLKVIEHKSEFTEEIRKHQSQLRAK